MQLTCGLSSSRKLLYITIIRKRYLNFNLRALINATLSQWPASHPEFYCHIVSYANKALRVFEALFPRKLKVPPEYLLEDTLCSGLNHIAVARNKPVKVPLVDPRCRRGKALAIAGTGAPPDHPLLSHRITLSAGQSREDLGEDTRVGIYTCL